VFAALVYFVLCYSMSLYARRLEQRLGVAEPRRGRARRRLRVPKANGGSLEQP
jgi:hypothetical protein